MSVDVCFVLCVERGRLENEALLLVRSVRRFAGTLRDAPIFSFQPRFGRSIRDDTLRNLVRLGVTHLSTPLNTQYRAYPLANKPICAAFVERYVDAEMIVLLDSDKVMFGEPGEVVQFPKGGPAVAVRPVVRKFIGTNGSDQNSEYWRSLYERLGIESRFRTQTCDTEETIWGYWNSGFVAARRSAGIFQLWQRMLETLLKNGWLPPGNDAYFGEQVSLAAAIDAAQCEVKVLPRSYNYPLALHNDLVKSGRAVGSFEDVVSIHYNKWFSASNDDRHPLDRLGSFDVSSPSAEWLREELARAGVYPAPERSVRKWFSTFMPRGRGIG